MSYRPKDWGNPFNLYIARGVISPNGRAEDYEAGADAMLNHIIELLEKSAPGILVLEILRGKHD